MSADKNPRLIDLPRLHQDFNPQDEYQEVDLRITRPLTSYKRASSPYYGSSPRAGATASLAFFVVLKIVELAFH
jgi:hypothetical protein